MFKKMESKKCMEEKSGAIQKPKKAFERKVY